MYSKTKLKLEPLSDIFDYEDNLNSELPFLIKKNLKIILDYYKISLIKLSFIINQNHNLETFLFITKDQKHIFSGGRFGFIGLTEFKDIDINKFLKTLEKKLIELNVKTCSLAFHMNKDFDEKKIDTKWRKFSITYLMAKISETINDNRLCFGNSKKRYNISRNLKKAKNLGFKCTLVNSTKDFDFWYYNCHLKRIEELGGKIWNYDILKKIVNDGTGNLIVAKNVENVIIGGCVFLKSDKILELFMMSTTREFLNLGVNYLLTEWLYFYAYENKIVYVNWQSSNPPIGPLVDYKKSWNSKEYPFTLLNWKSNDKISTNYLVENFQDFFIYPFNHLN